MSQALRKLAANASKCNCTVIFLNQLRLKVSTSHCVASWRPHKVSFRVRMRHRAQEPRYVCIFSRSCRMAVPEAACDGPLAV